MAANHGDALERLIRATEEKTKAEVLRRQAEDQRASEEEKRRIALERRTSVLEELTREVRAAMVLIRAACELINTKLDPTLHEHSAMLQLLLEVQRLVIPRLIEGGKGQAEVDRLTKLLMEIGKRGDSHVSMTTGDVDAGRDVHLEGG